MTPCTLSSLAELHKLGTDTIIDVRAPTEFAEDHIPGAINLPVLNDAERAQVGTMYTQISPFGARKIGAALVARNTATHLQGPLADKDGSWKPLVYCWRGGQRSGAFATILDQVGWRVHLLKGGYRGYRRLVVRSLYDTLLPHRLILIAGGTGTAKTEMLHHLDRAGAQVIDLEAMAAHRGSLFGAVATRQPSQKLFESRIAGALSGFDPARPVWVEAESSKIGNRIIPPMLWAAMTQAERIELSAPLAARAAYLTRAYQDLTDDPARLGNLIDQLRPFHARDRVDHWHALAANRAWDTLAEALVEAHYDPRYHKSAAAAPDPLHHITLEDLDDSSLARVAVALATDII